MDPNPVTGILVRRVNQDTDTEGRLREDTGRRWKSARLREVSKEANPADTVVRLVAPGKQCLPLKPPPGCGADWGSPSTLTHGCLREGWGARGSGASSGRTYERGTMMRKGPLMRLCSMRYVMSAMVWMVFPRPISSAKMPFRLLL